MNHPLCNPWEHQLSRRRVLQGASLAAGTGLIGGLLSTANAQELRQKQVLFIWIDGRQFAVVATNPGSNGNGRQLKNGEYVGNQSLIHL